jgi:hypothetical protein
MSFKTPDQGTRAEEAIEVASETPGENVQAQLFFLKNEVNHLELKACGSTPTYEVSHLELKARGSTPTCGHKTSTCSGEGSSPPYSVSCVQDTPGSTILPPVVLRASTEMLGVLEVMLIPMQKLQEDIGSHLKNLEEPHVDPPVPEPTSNRDRSAEKRATKFFAVARGKVPGIYPALDGRTLQSIQGARRR